MKLHKHLQFMLSRKRPAWGQGWSDTHDYISEAINNVGYHTFSDDAGNLICTTEFTGVLFSCHLDTVHRAEGDIEVRMDEFGIVTGWHQAQPVAQSGMCKGTVHCGHDPMHYAPPAEMTRCVLGADDAAGAYIMLRMIEENIPGTYVFHNSEEIGCLGSKDIASVPYSVGGLDLEQDFTHAIAFDRKGTSDFIHDQLGERMASAEFCAELITRLSAKGLNYRREIGLVTDTAMYADLVQECINLSVGYYDEHTENERLDYGHLTLLLDTILADPKLFIGLPVVRDNTRPVYSDWEDNSEPEQTVFGLVNAYPDAVADILEHTYGFDYDELFEALNMMEAA